MWNDSMVRNPDKKNLVPVLACGFKDLHTRLELQNQQRKNHETMVSNIRECIEYQVTRQEEFQVKMADYRRGLASNISKILSILDRIENLRRKGQPLNRDEEHLFSQLDKLYEELHKPGQFSSLLNDLSAAVKMQSKNDVNDYSCSLDEDTIGKIQDILTDFIKAMTSIIKDVNDNSRALNIIEKSFHDSYVEIKK